MLDYIFSRWSIVLALMAVASWYAYKAGNEYGPYAAAYKAVVAELNSKNAELEKQKADDKVALDAADRERDAAVAKLNGLKTCKATKAQAKAINSVKE